MSSLWRQPRIISTDFKPMIGDCENTLLPTILKSSTKRIIIFFIVIKISNNGTIESNNCLGVL